MLNKEVFVSGLDDMSIDGKESRWAVSTFWGRKLSVLGLVLIIGLIITAIFAPLLAPYDPYKQNLDNKLMDPSLDHLLGTDTLGRDTLSRIIYGARTSLMVSIFAVAIGSVIGQSLGLLAGFFGSWVNSIIMRIIDALMCMPPMLNALVIAVVLGGGVTNVVLALAFSVIPTQARLICAQTLSIKHNEYILAGQASGFSNTRIVLLHIYPNALAPVLVAMTIELGTCILIEGALSYLGVGIVPPIPAWGSMINDGYFYLLTNPILSIAPGFAIMLSVFGFNMAGDGLRDALDPRLREAA